jgi:hypothetical protein
MDDRSTMTKALDWVMDIDAAVVKGEIATLRGNRSGATNEELAESVFDVARRKAIVSGFATGMPSSPWVMFPAAVADVACVFRWEARAAAKVATIYQPDLLDKEDAKWELLVPIFGFDLASQFLRELGELGAVGITRQVIKKYMSRQTVEVLRSVALKAFGRQVARKAFLSKTLPIVGGIIGGAWNYAEVSIVKRRCIRYFEGETLKS